MDDFAQALTRESHRIEEDTLYSAKGHFEAQGRWSKVYLWVGLPTAVIAGVAGVAALSSHTTISAALSIAVAAATAVLTFLNPSEKATAHLVAGNKYNALRNNARIFREIELQSGATQQELAARIKELAAERDTFNRDSPAIPRWAFEAARKGIEAGEAKHAVDSGGSTSSPERY